MRWQPVTYGAMARWVQSINSVHIYFQCSSSNHAPMYMMHWLEQSICISYHLMFTLIRDEECFSSTIHAWKKRSWKERSWKEMHDHRLRYAQPMDWEVVERHAYKCNFFLQSSDLSASNYFEDIDIILTLKGWFL